MKKIFWLLLALALLLTSGCAAETSRKPVDTKYTAAYDSVETDYVYRYNWWTESYAMVPEVKSVHHNASYSIQWEISYDDGSTQRRWETCTYTEYQNAQKAIAANSE